MYSKILFFRMKTQAKRLNDLSDLPFKNDFVWFPNGHGGGQLLHRQWDSGKSPSYQLYTLPNQLTPALLKQLPEGAPLDLILERQLG